MSILKSSALSERKKKSMYSHEIQKLLIQEDFRISNTLYAKICSCSPQLYIITYKPFEDIFELHTRDNYHWKIKVYSDNGGYYEEGNN